MFSLDQTELTLRCRSECGYSAAVCSSLSSQTGAQQEVQVAVERYYVLYRNLAQSVLPALVLLLAGPLADRYGKIIPLQVRI